MAKDLRLKKQVALQRPHLLYFAWSSSPLHVCQPPNIGTRRVYLSCWRSVGNEGMTLVNHPAGDFLGTQARVHSNIPDRFCTRNLLKPSSPQPSATPALSPAFRSPEFGFFGFWMNTSVGKLGPGSWMLRQKIRPKSKHVHLATSIQPKRGSQPLDAKVD